MEQQKSQEVICDDNEKEAKAMEEIPSTESPSKSSKKDVEQQQNAPNNPEKPNVEIILQSTTVEADVVDESGKNENPEKSMSVSQEIDASRAKEKGVEPCEAITSKSETNTSDGAIIVEQREEDCSMSSTLPLDLNPSIDADMTESDSMSDSDSATESDSSEDVTQNKADNPEPQIGVQISVQSTGLGAIASQYQTDSETEDGNSSDSVEVVSAPSLQHRTPNVVISSDSDSDSDSDVEIVSQKNTPPKVIEIDDDEDESNSKPKGPVRAKGELLLEDLPPIQDLHITVPEEECVVLGKVHSFVEQLVLVDSLPGTAALDLDTVLFLEKGHKVLGEVFDVIGQVSSPLYCVRFNSSKEIKQKGIQVGETVYVAPRTEHTHFIILNNLTTIRGSDASWEDDVEPPEKHLDYSDDEEERNARRAIRNRRQQTEETEPPKKPKSLSRPTHQQGRFPRQRLPRGPPHHNQHPNGNTSQTPPFQYDSSNTTWHANYNSSTQYPNPFARPPHFTSPGNNRQMYNPSNYPQPQFNSPNSNMPQFASPNQHSSIHSNPQFVSPNMHIGADYSRAAFMPPAHPQMPFSPPQVNQQFLPPNHQNPLFPPNRPQFVSPDYGQYSSPPPPFPRQ